MKNNLEIVRAACIRAVPEIMELKFGCEVLTQKGSGVIVVESHMVGFGRGCKVILAGRTTVYEGKERDFEILGRPITLADVLRAIGNVDYQYIVSFDGHILKLRNLTETGLMTYEGTGVYWNLALGLLDQSEPTLSFLAGILK